MSRPPDPHDRPFVEDDALASPESADVDMEHTSAHTRDVEMAPDGSGRVVTDADRGEGATFDPSAGRAPDGGPEDIAADGGEDSASAGRAE